MRRQARPLLPVVIWAFSALLLAEGPGKLSISREQVLRAVEMARKGDRTELQQLLRHLKDLSRTTVLAELRSDFETLILDADTELQLLAAKGLFLLKDRKSKDVLVKYVSQKDYPKLRKDVESGAAKERDYQNIIYASIFAIGTLGEIGDEWAIPVLESLKGFKDFQMEFGGSPVQEALAKLGPKGFGSLAKVGPGASGEEISKAASAIRAVRDPKMAPALMATVKDKTCQESIRCAALAALGQIKEVDSLPFLVSVMGDGAYPKSVRGAAAHAAAATGRPEAEQPLLDLAGNPQSDIRVPCLLALGTLNPGKYVPKMLDFALDSTAAVSPRAKVVFQLERWARDPEKVELLRLNREALLKCLKAQQADDTPADLVRVQAWIVLNSATGEDAALELADPQSIELLTWHLERKIRGNIIGYGSLDAERHWVARKLSAILVSPEDPQKLMEVVKWGKYRDEAECAALAGLASYTAPDTLAFILEQANNPEKSRLVRGYALEVAGRTRRPEAETAILKLLEDPKSDLRPYCYIALTEFSPEKYFPVLLKTILDPAEPVRTRHELADYIIRVTREEPAPLKLHRELLVQGLNVQAKEPRDQDTLRVDFWVALYRATGEEMPVELASGEPSWIWSELREGLRKQQPNLKEGELQAIVREKLKTIMMKGTGHKNGLDTLPK